MSILYHVNVTSVEDTALTIKTKVVHPDSMYIEDSIGFALHLICNENYANFALGKEISLMNLLDENWMRNYANGFIKKVEILKKKNEPSQEVLDDYENSYWNDPENWFSAILKIEVTHEKWISHIKKNDSWDSTAFDPSSSYKKIDPIVPSSKKHILSKDYDSEGWMPIPSFLIRTDNEVPSVVYIPKYATTSYEIIEKISTGINAELAKSLEGKVLFAENKYSKEMGICIPNEDNIAIHSIGAGSSGTNFFYFDDIKYIGLAGFKENKKRRGNPLTYKDIFLSSAFKVKSAKVSENIVLFDFVGIRDLDEFNIKNKATVFKFICSTIINSSDEVDDYFRNHPLGKAIIYLNEKHNYDWINDFYYQYADAFIKSYTLFKTKEDFPDFDKMLPQEVINYIEIEKWPVTELQVEMYDKTFLDVFSNFISHFSTMDQIHPNDEIPPSSKPILWKDLSKKI